MIHVGDKLRFVPRIARFGRGGPVEVTSVTGDLVEVLIWEPFLCLGEEPYQTKMLIHKSWFETAVPGGDQSK